MQPQPGKRLIPSISSAPPQGDSLYIPFLPKPPGAAPQFLGFQEMTPSSSSAEVWSGGAPLVQLSSISNGSGRMPGNGRDRLRDVPHPVPAVLSGNEILTPHTFQSCSALCRPEVAGS